MITKESIDSVMEAADIVEVISEYVTMKKRGANYVGLSPFATEKTPSFTVSPAKQIFKDFSSGKGGSVVTFLMEHEKFSYPEAIKWLAKKYQIVIEETGQQQDPAINDEKESLFIVNNYAQSYFSQTLLNTPEGINIGLSYYKERGLSSATIEKFGLGYSQERWDHFAKEALAKGYKTEYLIAAGLVFERDGSNEMGLLDRFRGRVIFPIHNLSGRVLGFGGRILKSDDKAAKYINSPESIIYHKSDTLYGIHLAKDKIRLADCCLLTEGYMDVISLHQHGIENVVASSGTSLTQEQIQLIRRFTSQVTLLYDGDSAGIKASLRAIDLILAAGLNVKIVLLPDQLDPDSYVRKVGSLLFQEYITANQQDFIPFKARALNPDANKDPIKQAEIIRSVIESIALIPDSIKASLFIEQAAQYFDIASYSLSAELNKILLGKDQNKRPELHELSKLASVPNDALISPASSDKNAPQEQEIIRLLLLHAEDLIDMPDGSKESVAKFLIGNLEEIIFEHPIDRMFELAKAIVSAKNPIIQTLFTHHPDQEISQISASLLSLPLGYQLSDGWNKKYGIIPPSDEELIPEHVYSAIHHIKLRKLLVMIDENSEKIKTALSEEEANRLVEEDMRLNEIKRELAANIGLVTIWLPKNEPNSQY